MTAVLIPPSPPPRSRQMHSSSNLSSSSTIHSLVTKIHEGKEEVTAQNIQEWKQVLESLSEEDYNKVHQSTLNIWKFCVHYLRTNECF